jgi:hypothetical protein
MKRSAKITKLTIPLFALGIITPLTLSYSSETTWYHNKIDRDLKHLLREYQDIIYKDAKTFRQWTNNLHHQYGQNLIKMLADKTSELSINFDSDVVTNAVYLNEVAQGKMSF